MGGARKRYQILAVGDERPEKPRHRAHVEHILIAVVVGLTKFPAAITAAFSDAIIRPGAPPVQSWIDPPDRSPDAPTPRDHLQNDRIGNPQTAFVGKTVPQTVFGGRAPPGGARGLLRADRRRPARGPRQTGSAQRRGAVRISRGGAGKRSRPPRSAGAAARQAAGWRLIPTASVFDLRPLSLGCGGETLRPGHEAVPRGAADVDDVVLAVEDPVREGVPAEMVPEGFERVEVGALWRQRHQGEGVRDDRAFGDVPAGSVENV